MGIENRRHPRWDLNLTIKYKSLHSKGFSFGKLLVPHTKSTSINISLGGTLFRSAEKFEQGSQIQLKIDFPASDATVIATGEVLYAKKEGSQYMIGVRFLDLQTEADDILGDMLNQQLQQIKGLPAEKQAEAKRRVIERLFMSLIQTETNQNTAGK